MHVVHRESRPSPIFKMNSEFQSFCIIMLVFHIHFCLSWYFSLLFKLELSQFLME